MAAPLTPAEQAELNRLLEENAEIKERIRVINEKIATAQGSEKDDLERMIGKGYMNKIHQPCHLSNLPISYF